MLFGQSRRDARVSAHQREFWRVDAPLLPWRLCPLCFHLSLVPVSLPLLPRSSLSCLLSHFIIFHSTLSPTHPRSSGCSLMKNNKSKTIGRKKKKRERHRATLLKQRIPVHLTFTFSHKSFFFFFSEIYTIGFFDKCCLVVDIKKKFNSEVQFFFFFQKFDVNNFRNHQHACSASLNLVLHVANLIDKTIS